MLKFFKNSSFNKQSNNHNSGRGEPNISTSLAVLMWFLLFMGYILFIVNWTVGAQIGGEAKDGGYIAKFFNDGGGVPAITSQAVSYTITLVRGLASLAIGWIMVKISHKYACVISLALLIFGFIAAFMPNYPLFIISRLFMALGGTMLIVFLQPIIARFFAGKSRGFISSISVQGYTSGGFISFGLILNATVRVILIQNYTIVLGVIGGIAIIPTVLYLIFGKNFNVNSKSQGEIQQVNLKPQTYFGIIKESQTIVYSLWYGFWLVVAVISTFFLPKVFTTLYPYLDKEVLQAGGIVMEWKVFNPFIFFLGALMGFFGVIWNRLNVKRKPFLIILSIMKLVCLILIIIGAQTHVLWLTYLSFFLMGVLIFATQGIFFNMPHEYGGNTPRRMIIFFSYVWGFGYIIYTVCNIIAAALLPVSAWGSLGFIIACFVFAIIFAALIKESKPNAPWLFNFKFKSSKRMLSLQR